MLHGGLYRPVGDSIGEIATDRLQRRVVQPVKRHQKSGICMSLTARSLLLWGQVLFVVPGAIWLFMLVPLQSAQHPHDGMICRRRRYSGGLLAP